MDQALRDVLSGDGKPHAATALLLIVASLILAAPPVQSAELKAQAILRGRAGAVQSQVPWIEDGFGKLVDGGDANDFESTFQGEAQLGVDLRAGDAFRLHLHGLARTQPSTAAGRHAGLVEAFILY